VGGQLTRVPELSIVVVNWNGGELFRRCIESVRRHPPSMPYEIIVVDNASTDDSLAWARSLEPPLRIITNTENVGFARANNQAFAQGRSALVFLLNADAEVMAGTLDRLAATLRQHPRAAMCAPRLLNTDGTLQPSVWPNPLTPLHIVLSSLGLWRLLPRALRGRLLYGDQWTYDSLRAVPMAGGAALMIRRETIDEVQGFAECFPMYGEDYEWGLRVRRAGWVVLFEPGVTVMHHSGSFARRRWADLDKLKLQTEAFLKVQQMTLSRAHRLANLVTLVAVTSAQILWRRLRRHPRDAARLQLKLYRGALARDLRPARVGAGDEARPPRSGG
jgi:N-acetylglucosaminyl-diphospho-decaprenol L-rhamnosyltransferase